MKTNERGICVACERRVIIRCKNMCSTCYKKHKNPKKQPYERESKSIRSYLSFRYDEELLEEINYYAENGVIMRRWM